MREEASKASNATYMPNERREEARRDTKRYKEARYVCARSYLYRQCKKKVVQLCDANVVARSANIHELLYVVENRFRKVQFVVTDEIKLVS